MFKIHYNGSTWITESRELAEEYTHHEETRVTGHL